MLRGSREILGRGYKRAVDERAKNRKVAKKEKKRSSKKCWGKRQKSGGAANLRSAPDG